MRVFIDTEFVENGPQIPLKLVSIALVREDGKELYLIVSECLTDVARHSWTRVNIMPNLPIHEDDPAPGQFIVEWDVNHADFQYVMALDMVAQQVLAFLQATPDLELWGYYAAFDHVLLTHLFGDFESSSGMGIPMFTHELQQVIEIYPEMKLPPQPEITHHALWDARWNRDAFNILNESR